jgi:predicted amidohydrolase YtcJ
MLAHAALLLLAAAAQAEPADLILSRGKIFLSPGRYAQSLAIAGNRISAVGTDADVLGEKGPKTRVIDLAGRLVLPGFHDANNGFLQGALIVSQLRLGGAKTPEAAAKKIELYAAEHPDDPWIIGRGWDPAKFNGGKLPTAADFDMGVSTRPAIMYDVTRTRAWLNSLGMERAGISARTPIIHNGEIVKDQAGQPTGVIGGDALQLARRAIPPPSKRQKLEALRLALKLARSHGVTSIDVIPVPDESSLAEKLALWRELLASREATARLFLYGSLDSPSDALRQRVAARDLPRVKLQVAGVAANVDADLSGRAAALLEPYFDDPRQRGTPRYAAIHLDLDVKAAHKLGLQVALHAAGDRAVRLALDACAKSQQKAKREAWILPEFPCRIEEAAVVSPDDLPRFKALSAAVIAQPGAFVFEDQLANFIPNRVGDRARWAVPLKSLEDAGATVAFGTGWPTGDLDPRPGLFFATARQSLDGKPEQGWFPQERVALEAAIEHSTLDAARVVGLEDELGSIRPGKLADLAVFSDDLLSRSGASLFEPVVALTIFDGKIVYDIEATDQR